MKQLIIILTTTLWISACNQTPQQFERYKSFPEEKTVTSEVIEIDTAVFRYPFRITIKDNIALIMDLHNPDHYLHAFSYPDFKHLVAFCKRGEGPNEVLSIENFQFNSLDSIWVLDYNKSNILLFSIAPQTRTYEVKKSFKIDESFFRTMGMYVRENDIVILDPSGKNRYHILDHDGKLLSTGGSIPQESSKDLTNALAMGWRPYIGFNMDDTGYMYLATQFSDIIEIYNLNNDSAIIKYGPSGEPKFVIGNNDEGYPDGILGFTDIFVTENYIYVPFEGQLMNTKTELYFQGLEPETGGKTVYVFDLKGNPIKKYLLDRPIIGIYVNEKEGYFIGLDVNSEESVVKYSL